MTLMAGQGRSLRLRLLSALLALSAQCGFAVADDGEPLPSPLSFEQALTLADDHAHPVLAAASARYDAASAGVRAVRAADDVTAGIEARARWIEPADSSIDQSHDDSSAVLYLRKRLYDFGQQRAGVRAATSERREQEWRLVDTRHRHRIDVATAYFDVLLADLTFMRDDEDMAMAYVRLDRAEERNDLGQVSDIVLRERQFEYQQVRRLRYASAALQQTARAELANLLNRPGELSKTLLDPELGDLDRDPPALDEIYAEALAHNPRLLALRARGHAAKARIQQAEVSGRPTLDAEVEAGEYARQTSSRDDVRAGLILDIPLYTGSRVRAAVDMQRAESRARDAETYAAEVDLRQQLLSLREEIITLRVQREAAQAELDFRDLYLDRSRALYEMEVTTDLGDAMARFSEARLNAARAEYLLALAWARLDALLGREPFAMTAHAPAPTEERNP